MNAAKSIYVIGADDGPFKIGVAKDPQSRMKSIQNGNPHKVHIVYSAISDNPFSIESLAHHILDDCRLEGEWFGTTKAEAINAITEAIERFVVGDKPKFTSGFKMELTLPTATKLMIDENLDFASGETRSSWIRGAIDFRLLNPQFFKER